MLVRNPDPTSMTDNAQSLFIYFLAKKKKKLKEDSLCLSIRTVWRKGNKYI